MIMMAAFLLLVIFRRRWSLRPETGNKSPAFLFSDYVFPLLGVVFMLLTTF